MVPKFRAFVKSGTKQMYGGIYEEDVMVPVGVLDITGEEVTVWGCGRENCGMCDDYFRMKDIILMQTTGLKDKDGVEIYEGDVVELNVPTYKKTTKIIGDLYDAFILDKNVESISHIEVIGNVYENPDLLKEVQHDRHE